ncbi:hypothetical protein CCR94_17580 [Rhodoblastus sphagnicola]|uniref:Uncharacterized protein n=1 Tax=Rhodoblastus sphagnicola TaxID=333368 RepID=A0A2S6N1K7_9HYPH|nr:hypothetical protein [Rhodoblastus sphagnicola]MBB4199190.1 hypothetical protein [Rhodoblastus sphagnicola]PPQ28507.1 hypothetical protein CCR94_17580 [Rhodoblastus sphagnicola]
MSGEVTLNITDHGQAQLRLQVEGGTIWLSQAEMADLFLAEGELAAAATVKEYLAIQIEGERSRKDLNL